MAALVQETIGTGGTYASVSAWHAATQLNLVALDQVREGQCLNQAHAGSTLTISGATVDATRFRRLTVASGAGHTMVRPGGARVNFAINVSEAFFQFVGTAHSVAASLGVRFLAGGTDGLADKLLVYDCGTSPAAHRGIEVLGANCTVRNCTALKNVSGGIVLNSTGGVVYNCTSLNNGQEGIAVSASGAAAVRNCIAGGNFLSDFSGLSFVTTKSHLISADTSAAGQPNSSGSVSMAATLTSPTSGSENIHLIPGSAALNAGVDLSGTGFAVDGEGQARPQGAAWDIGADEDYPDSIDPDTEVLVGPAYDVILGLNGQRGDALDVLEILPTADPTGAVSIRDGSGSLVTVFSGGVGALTKLKPISARLGARSASGAWKATLGAGVSIKAVGRFNGSV